MEPPEKNICLWCNREDDFMWFCAGVCLRCGDSMMELQKVELIVGFAKAVAEVQRLQQHKIELRAALRDFRDNFDCDRDAHKYGTTCRCCRSSEALDGTA